MQNKIDPINECYLANFFADKVDPNLYITGGVDSYIMKGKASYNCPLTVPFSEPIINGTFAESNLFWKIGIHSHRWMDSVSSFLYVTNIDECAALSFHDEKAFILAFDDHGHLVCYLFHAKGGEPNMRKAQYWRGPSMPRVNAIETLYWRSGKKAFKKRKLIPTS